MSFLLVRSVVFAHTFLEVLYAFSNIAHQLGNLFRVRTTTQRRPTR